MKKEVRQAIKNVLKIVAVLTFSLIAFVLSTALLWYLHFEGYNL